MSDVEAAVREALARALADLLPLRGSPRPYVVTAGRLQRWFGAPPPSWQGAVANRAGGTLEVRRMRAVYTGRLCNEPAYWTLHLSPVPTDRAW